MGNITKQKFMEQPTVSWATRRDILITFIAGLVILYMAFWLLGHIGHTILITLLAIFIAYALYPAVSYLEKRMPRTVAVLIVYLIVFLGLGALAYSLTTAAITQFMLLAKSASTLLSPNSAALKTLEHVGLSQARINDFAGQLVSQLQSVTTRLVPLLSGIASSFLDVILVAVVSIYLILDAKRITESVHNNTPLSQKPRMQFFFDTIQNVVGGYIRGQVLLALLIGLLVGVGMLLFRVPYALLLGVVAFIFAFIPILGTFLSGAVCVVLALTKGWLIALLVLAYFVLVHIVEGDVVGPRIVGKTVGLRPLVSILALIAGSELFGIPGALFASPVAGVIQALAVAGWVQWKNTHPQSFAASPEAKVVDAVVNAK